MSGRFDNWIREVRTAIRNSEREFFKMSPFIYWRDFLLSIMIAYTAATFYLRSPLFSWTQILAYPIAVFWLYRTGSLIHEIAHLNQNEMRTFKAVWNLVGGVVMLTPSPFYSAHHRDHHTPRMFGTKEDPDYVVNYFKRGSALSLLAYAVLVLVFPVLVTVRFILAPFTFLHPQLREFVLTRCSSLMLNPRYVRRVSKADRRKITAIELLCCVRATMIPVSVLIGLAHWTRIPTLYVLGVSVLILNQMRLLADHHYASDGDRMSYSDHILDSCNFTGRDFLTWLLFPFSIRYHALHHVFPSMPYHNLVAANVYLLNTLPADSPYRGLDQPNWFSVASKTVRARYQGKRTVTDGVQELVRRDLVEP